MRMSMSRVPSRELDRKELERLGGARPAPRRAPPAGRGAIPYDRS